MCIYFCHNFPLYIIISSDIMNYILIYTVCTQLHASTPMQPACICTHQRQEASTLQDSSRHPTVKWAQRSGAEDIKLKLEPERKFFFSGTSVASKTPYEVDLLGTTTFLFCQILDLKASVSSTCVCYLVKKAEKVWSNRMIKQEEKAHVYLKVDWEKRIDEDEEDEGKE
ncbi:hypothetical protein EUTSA_v10000448mg [Eutrema salsugineum]|uniref:Co-chaperone protein p23 n=1 Tax=Eutrema salsugineum TaxID=72664 RepID=V4LW09_EUTSA|nr:hypothetical protein EUTSA_v10000448mg [Eutrema salsugineum]